MAEIEEPLELLIDMAKALATRNPATDRRELLLSCDTSANHLRHHAPDSSKWSYMGCSGGPTGPDHLPGPDSVIIVGLKAAGWWIGE